MTVDCPTATIAIRRARNELERARDLAAAGDFETAIRRARLAWKRADEARSALTP